MTIYQVRHRVQSALGIAGGCDEDRIATAADVDEIRAALVAVLDEARLQASRDDAEWCSACHTLPWCYEHAK